ncbi:unnamed protein product [Ectocarpus sp. 12 AP-2014]
MSCRFVCCLESSFGECILPRPGLSVGFSAYSSAGLHSPPTWSSYLLFQSAFSFLFPESSGSISMFSVVCRKCWWLSIISARGRGPRLTFVCFMNVGLFDRSNLSFFWGSIIRLR